MTCERSGTSSAFRLLTSGGTLDAFAHTASEHCDALAAISLPTTSCDTTGVTDALTPPRTFCSLNTHQRGEEIDATGVLRVP